MIEPGPGSLPCCAPARASQDVPALTALRAIAALLVFLYHFAPKGLPGLAGVVAGQGHVGVTVFFVLSGFLITVRYYPQLARGEHALGDYFVRRMARILPLYYVVLALTHLLTTGSVPVDTAHLPEWTLTQALFGSAAPDDITVPTSWSLTVEECFYASAPLLYLCIAAVRRRLGGWTGAAAVLGTVTGGLFLVGSLLVRIVGGRDTGALPFLSQEPLLRYYTVFGRFPDFAFGVAAGLLFLSGHVEQAWRRRGGTVWAMVMAAAGATLLVAGQAGMGRDGTSPDAEWRWNLLVALASAVIVVALTCRRSPLSRLLSGRPAVYLGRVSYALYLIQLTPLGNGVLSHILPGTDPLSLLALYIGMNLIAALLFELVEEPAREVILSLRRSGSLTALPLARNGVAYGLSLAILFGGLAAQHVVWALGSLPPLDETRVVNVLGADSHALVRANVVPPTPEGGDPRLRLPSSWQRGPTGDRWAPRSLRVFVDGRPVPFLGARPPDTPEIAAYYHGRRAGELSLQIAQPAAVTVVNDTPLVTMTLAWSRLLDAPAVSIAPLVLLGAAGLVVYWSRVRIWAPRACLAGAVCLLFTWLVSGVHLEWWAPLVLLLELVVLTWLILSQRAVSSRDARMALDTQPLSARRDRG